CLVQYSLAGCGTTASGLNGTITSLTPPQRQLHISEFKCRWNIELQETAEPRHVELTFVRFNMTGVMPTCLDGDYIELFLGCNNSKSIGKFCGQTLLPVVYSSDHCLQIVFHFFMAIIPRRRSMFQAIYKQRLLSTAVSQDNFGCGKDNHAYAKNGNIFSPHWPLPYPRYVDCVWRVTTRPGFHVKLVFFDFDVRSSDKCAEADFIEVKTRGFSSNQRKPVTQSKQCGTKPPLILIIEDDTIFIQFKSHAMTGNRGFMAGFVTYSIGKNGKKSNKINVLILLGVIFLALLAPLGKAFLQKLVDRNTFARKNIFYRFRRRSKTPSTSPMISNPWREPHEVSPDRISVATQDEKPFDVPWAREERSPSKTFTKTVTFGAAAPQIGLVQ
ncbi:protein tolkin-like, partial [Porites lutea]|uniref:protein tolkin-like n=1 Tax=Porites lutea TaxID=51062 RepID=UPI003CC68A64